MFFFGISQKSFSIFVTIKHILFYLREIHSEMSTEIERNSLLHELFGNVCIKYSSKYANMMYFICNISVLLQRLEQLLMNKNHFAFYAFVDRFFDEQINVFRLSQTKRIDTCIVEFCAADAWTNHFVVFRNWVAQSLEPYFVEHCIIENFYSFWVDNSWM